MKGFEGDPGEPGINGTDGEKVVILWGYVLSAYVRTKPVVAMGVVYKGQGHNQHKLSV